MKKTIFIFGNPDLEIDSLPLQILPELQKTLPEIEFIIKDPNEEWNVPEEMVIIDTVVGLDKVTIFDDIDEFVGAPQVSMHDFDALTNLRFLKKLGKLKKIKVIGVPPNITKEIAFDSVKKAIL